MKHIFGMLAIIAFLVFGLSPPVQATDIDTYDQTEFCQDIDHDATFSVLLPVSEDVHVTVLKYPDADLNSYTEIPESIVLTSQYICTTSVEIENIRTDKDLMIYQCNSTGLYRLGIGELNNGVT